MNEIAISVKALSKSFKVPHERRDTLKTKALNIFSGGMKYSRYDALRNISFEVKRGEFFGIVGKNGCGKSTLLKIIAGIYQPTKGSVIVNGAIAPFIELGVGFNPELTGRDNVFLSGTILGMSRKKIESLYSEIVEFAEMSEFMDQKLKNYSSGMQVRLAFSIAIRSDSDILLIDEVLAVGDAAFQQKCLNYFEKLKQEKRTVIFVSHDMNAVSQFCNKAVFIEDSRLKAEGSSYKIAQEYLRANLPKDKNQPKLNSDFIESVSTVSANNKKKNNFEINENIFIDVKWKPNNAIQNIGVAIFREDGTYCYGTNTLIDNYKIINNQIKLKLNRPPLAPGRYSVKINAFGLSDQHPVEFVDEACSFNIVGATSRQGIVSIISDWN